MFIPKQLVEVPMERGILKTFYDHLLALRAQGLISDPPVREALAMCETAMETYHDSPEFKQALLGLKNRKR